MPGPGGSNSAEAREGKSAPSSPAVDITGGQLADALGELAREAGVSIGTEGALPRIKVRHLRGNMTVGQALDGLLAGTGYVARQVGSTSWRIERAPPPPPPVAVAADPLPPPPPPVPIVVTATKQPLSLGSVAASISVVNDLGMPGGDAVRSSTALVASRIDGLAVTALGPGRNRMFLRGVADSAFGGESQATVAVVLDEARLTYAAPDPDIRLVDMARVEVLKGPQGSLYGTGALGGIYRMVTQPADLEDTSLTISGGGGLRIHGGTGYSSSAVFNLPIVEGTAGLRLVGYSALEPGWIDSGDREEGNSTYVSGMRGQIGIVPFDRWRIDVSGMAQWINSRDSRYAYVRRSYHRPAQAAEPHDNDLNHAAIRVQGPIGGVAAMLSTALTLQEMSNVLDASVGASQFGVADPRLLFDEHRYRVWDTELRLRGKLGAASWLFGISHLDAAQTLDTTLTSGASATISLENNRRDSHDTAAYMDVTVPISAAFFIEGGGRVFRASIRDTQDDGEVPISRKRDKSGVTPELAVSWKPNANRLVYLRYGSAFRQGATTLSRSSASNLLEGDELASIEAGWRERLAFGASVEATVWYSQWDHVQSDTLASDGLINTIDAGDARIFGIEASATVPLPDHWQAEAGGNVTSAAITRNDLGYELHDTRLPVVPDYTVRAALRRDFSLAGFTAWARLDVRYVGPARMSFDPDLDRKMGNLIESGAELNLSSGRLSLGLTARNLFGSKGNVFSFGNPLRYRTMPQYTAQEPLSVRISASLSL